MTMSAVMSQKEIRVLIKHLQEQGLVFTRTTKGYRAPLPDTDDYKGEFVTIHTSASEARGTMNLRAMIKRHGLTWPTDNEMTKKQDWEQELPAYMLEGPPLAKTVKRIEEVIGRLTASGDTGITPKQVMDLTGIRDNATVYRGMLHLSWAPSHEKSGRSRVWMKLPDPEGVVPGGVEEDEEPGEFPEVQNARANPPVERPREFIDTANSWTLHHNLASIQDVTVRELRGMMLAAGLFIEIRVWPGATPRLTSAESADAGKVPSNGG